MRKPSSHDWEFLTPHTTKTNLHNAWKNGVISNKLTPKKKNVTKNMWDMVESFFHYLITTWNPHIKIDYFLSNQGAI